MAGLYFAPMMSSGETTEVAPDEVGVELDLLEIIELVEPELLQAEQAEEAANLVKNVNSESIDTRVSYRSQQQIAESTMDELKDLEKQFFEEAAANREPGETYEADIPEEKEREMYEYAGKSFDGPVMVEYNLNNPVRSDMVKHVPVYKCEGSGTITVNVVVDQMGKVMSADVNPSKSTTLNECLVAEALASSKKWVFDSSFSHPKKQEGTIVYRFQAQ